MPKIPYQYISELGLDGQARVYNTLDSERKNQYGSLDLEPAKSVISRAAHKVFPGEPISLVSGKSPLYDPEQIARSVVPERFLEAQIRRVTGKLISFDDDVLFLDIETHNAEKRWDMDVREFFRLGQYAWGEGDVQITESLDELLEQMGKAKVVYAHNGHNFDFSVLLGDDALHWAYNERLFDTLVYASLHFPTPTKYEHANGRSYTDYNTTPTHVLRWLGLENLAFQFGFEGKLGNLQELAQRHNPKGTKVADLDYGLIPVDDPDFQGYAKQDIPALRELTRSMLSVVPEDAYSKRAQFMAAIDAQMTRNGITINVPEVNRRIAEAQQKTNDILESLVKEFDFPTEGKKPWVSKAGKESIQRILASYGITPETSDWPKTEKGALSFGREAMLSLTEGTDAEEVGNALATLQGQRPLAQQTLEYTHMDGKVHPDVNGVQRSGRRSTSRPGLTTYDNRDKDYFVAAPGWSMVECDLSNSDARGVAIMSGDKERYKWFLPGVDSHEIVGRIVFGDSVYESYMLDGWEEDVHIRKQNPLRSAAKPFNHGTAFNMQAKKLANTYNKDADKFGLDHMSKEDCQAILDRLDARYPGVARWRKNLISFATKNGYVESLWGRKLWITKGREFNQAVALPPQSFTTEVLYDGLIRLYETRPDYLKYILASIHDAILCSAPIYEMPHFVETLLGCVSQTIEGLDVFMEAGTPAENWKNAQHN